MHCPACGKCWCCGRPLIEVQPWPMWPWPKPVPDIPYYRVPRFIVTTTTTTPPEQPLPDPSWKITS